MIFIMEGMEQISSMVVPETLGEYLKQRPEVFPVQQVIWWEIVQIIRIKSILAEVMMYIKEQSGEIWYTEVLEIIRYI